MKEVFVINVNVNRFENLCAEMVDTQSLIGPSMAMVTGPAGRGKSEAAKRYAINSEAAVYIPPMIKTSPTMLLQEITLDLAKVKRGRIADALEIIQAEMARNRRLIIIDEADLVPLPILEMLRNINERYSCPILLIGEDGLKGKIASRRRIDSRMRRRMEFEPVNQPDILLFFRKALSVNINGDVTALIHKYCEGDWRPVLKIASYLERAIEASDLHAIHADLVREIINEADKQ